MERKRLQADALLYGGQHAADIDRIWAARGISTNYKSRGIISHDFLICLRTGTSK